MKNLAIFACFLLLHTMLKAQPCREIVGYYPAWKWYARNQLVAPNTIKYDRYSVINYAFFRPEKDGTIRGTDDWADENLLQGKINWETAPKSHYPNTSLVDLAHKAGVKVLISIGGWSDSDVFHTIAADAEKRQTFANECARLTKFYNLDGIDIDWEYPGFAEHKGTPADKQNFTLLLRGVKEKLSALTKETDRNYLLTAAFGASPSNMANIEWDNVAPLLDAINLMTYDFYGTWTSETGHHAPLFAASEKDNTANAHATAMTLTETYNVPSSKINLGLAFYGRSFKTKGAPNLYAPSLKKTDKATFKNGENYHDIAEVLKKGLFTEHWDDTAKTSYLTGKNELHTFVSYENIRSVTEKAKYVLNKNLRGVIVWELTGDYIQNTSRGDKEGVIETPLIDAVHATFCNPPLKTGDSTEVKKGAEKPIVSNQKVEMATDIVQQHETDKPKTLPEPPREFKVNADESTPVISIENREKQPEPFTEIQANSTELVEDFTVFTDENGFLILKFNLKQRSNICLKIMSDNGAIRRDFDLGEIGEGFYEHWATTHKDLPSGIYKVWIDACETAFNPKKSFKEWRKE